MKNLLCWLVLFSHPIQAADKELKAFPPPEEGMTRYVLKLPAKEDESLRKIELLVGKTVEVDSVNRFFFGGRIEKENIQGWGYTRYVVKDLGPMAGTRIGVPPGTPKVARFIPLGGEPLLIRYNSKLPVVVYVPEGGEVRYRLWSAPAEYLNVPEG